MQFDWRAISGPALTTATALIAFVVDRQFIAVPNPAPLFVCIVAFAASVNGIASGMISAAIAVAYSAAFFLEHRAVPGYDMSDLSRMLLLAATAAGTAGITGLLRQKWIDAFASEQAHHATAMRLSAALDQVDIGIVLLDSDTRAEFINRAFRDYFCLTDEQADLKPPFIALWRPAPFRHRRGMAGFACGDARRAGLDFHHPTCNITRPGDDARCRACRRSRTRAIQAPVRHALCRQGQH